MKWKLSVALGAEDDSAKLKAYQYVDKYCGRNSQTLIALSAMKSDQAIDDRYHLRNMACLYDWLYDDMVADDTHGAARRAGLIDAMLAWVYVRQNNTGPDSATAQSLYDCNAAGLADPLYNHYHHSFLSATYAAIATHGEQPATFKWPPNTGTEYTFRLYFDVTDSGGVETFTGTSALWDWLVGDANHNQVEDLILPAMDDYCEGGSMPEGLNYSLAAMSNCCEAMQMLDQSCGFTFGQDHADVFRNAILYQFYAEQPGSKHMASINDNNGGAIIGISESNLWDASASANAARTDELSRVVMLRLVDWFNGDTEAEYGQYWLESIAPTIGSPAESDQSIYKPYEFLLRDDDRTATDHRTVLPLYYYAPGVGFVNSRSSWASDAVSVTTQCTYKQQEKQHGSCNEIQIWKRPIPTGRDHAWLVMDATVNGSNKDDWQSNYHSAYTIFATGSTNGYCQRQEHGLEEEDITRFCATPAFTYSQGTANKAFGQSNLAFATAPGVAEGTDDGSTISDRFTREIVHYKPGFIVVFDRVRVTAVAASTTIQARWHYPFQPDDSNPMFYKMDADTVRLFQRVMIASPSFIAPFKRDDLDLTGVEGSVTNAYRYEMSHPCGTSRYARLCNVFEVATTSQTNMTPMYASPTTSQFQNGATWTMAGVTIQVDVGAGALPPGLDPGSTVSIGYQHFLFSEEQDASTPTSIDYCVFRLNVYDMHRVFNLVPGEKYNVTETRLKTTSGSLTGYYKYHLEPNDYGSVTANSAGVAEFRPPVVLNTPLGRPRQPIISG